MSEAIGESVVIASAADAAYACPLAVMLRSVREALSPTRRLEAHLIDGGLGDALRARIEASLPRDGMTVHWHVPERRGFSGLPLWGRMSVATYDKLLVPDLVPSRVTKVLWLDADVLARADVAALWDAELGQAPLRAVPDPLVRRVGARLGVGGWKALGLDPGAPYFNAGVLVMNVPAWRADDIGGKALEHARRHWEQVYFLDQEALNAVLAGRWDPLEPAWNWSPSLGPAGIEPRLVHFAGNLKPWRYRGQTRWHALYYAALDQTAWRGWRPNASAADWAAWYWASRLRRRLRPMERWHMTFTRWRTLRTASLADVQPRLAT